MDKSILLKLYKKGDKIKDIAKSLETNEKNVLETLKIIKNENKFGRSFTDSFKQIIAERDMNDGISRRQISSELGINGNTVKRACEQFGQAMKEIASSDNEFTPMRGNFTTSECPTCKSKKVNFVDDKDTITYCMSCGNEHSFKEYASTGIVHRVNWEYLN